MNIIIDKNIKNDSKQPIIYDLGEITTTLQDLLDSSKIVISGEQTVILSIKDTNNNNYYYLLPLDYNGSGIYGLGQNITENDFVLINKVLSRSYLYKAILNKTNFTGVIATVLENNLKDNIIITYNEQLIGNNFFTDILIEHPIDQKLYIPLFNQESSSFDESVKMFRYSLSPTETVISLEFPVVDFQKLDNFPFEIIAYD